MKGALGMPHRKGFSIDRRVGIATTALAPAQRAAVSRVLHSPQSFAALASDSSRVGRIKNPAQDLYTLRITPSIRLIFTKTAEGVQVLDLVERATLDRLAAEGVGEQPQAKAARDRAKLTGPKATKASALAKKS